MTSTVLVTIDTDIDKTVTHPTQSCSLVGKGKHIRKSQDNMVYKIKIGIKIRQDRREAQSWWRWGVKRLKQDSRKQSLSEIKKTFVAFGGGLLIKLITVKRRIL